MTANRERFIRHNYLKWNKEGMKIRERRLQNGLSLRDAAKLLGTSATRIRKFEIGEPVAQAEHVKKSCNLLYDHIELHAALLKLKNTHSWRG